MNWEVQWEPAAINQAAGFLETHPNDLPTLFSACDELADNERPSGSSPWGVDYRRLRRGAWRLLYPVDSQNRTIRIEHVGYAAG